MKTRILIGGFLGLFLIASGVSANEFGDMPEVKALTQGQPADVAALIDRIVECNHWGGEEPYDKARADEIAQAMAKAGCIRIKAEEKALRKKYGGNRKTLEAIGKAEDLGM